jgi:hypothetical protein
VLAGSHLAFAFDDTSPPYFARVATACPGSVSVLGSGCAGQLTAPLPWVGATWTSTGTQLPPVAFVARGFGFATLTLPLSAVSPQAGPGCDLLISPDIVDFVLSTTGTVTTGVPIPNVPALAGSVFHHQLVPFGLDAALNIVSVTSTPALTLTIGTL